jgi:uncharacterized protein YecE (DUF72 family)
MSRVKVGCCGFPRGRKAYYQQFRVVEIQQTFYKPPSVEIVKKWREEAPQDFEFSLKAWQLITHLPSSPTYRKAGLKIPAAKESNYGLFKPGEEVFEAWAKTQNVAEALEAKVILFQCPAKFTETSENIANLRHFFTSINRGDFVFVWEPRGKWSNEVIMELCQDLDLVHCVDPLERVALWGKPRYFRLHGGRDYRHQYTNDELMRLLELTRTEDYVLFNNLTMYDDALSFIELAKGR